MSASCSLLNLFVSHLILIHFLTWKTEKHSLTTCRNKYHSPLDNTRQRCWHLKYVIRYEEKLVVEKLYWKYIYCYFVMSCSLNTWQWFCITPSYLKAKLFTDLTGDAATALQISYWVGKPPLKIWAFLVQGIEV